jgi:hypothetical protein
MLSIKNEKKKNKPLETQVVLNFLTCMKMQFLIEKFFLIFQS